MMTDEEEVSVHDLIVLWKDGGIQMAIQKLFDAHRIEDVFRFSPSRSLDLVAFHHQRD